MSKYTTEVRFICEMAAGLDQSAGFNDIDKVLEKAVKKVFNFDFPIFDEAYRFNLEKKILRHFYTREICEETVGLWKLRLQTKLEEIMPYYNQLYLSTLKEFDPFVDVDYTVSHQGNGKVKDISSNKRTGDNTGASNSTTHSDGNDSRYITDKTVTTDANTAKQYTSDTPQGHTENPEDVGYLSGVQHNVGVDDTTVDKDVSDAVQRINTDETSGSSVSHVSENALNERTADTIDQYMEHVFGKRNTVNYSKVLIEFRKTFLNIDKQVMDDLEDLFFMLW